MNEKQRNASYRAAFLEGLPLAIYGAAELARQMPKRRPEDPQLVECWNCWEMRPDDLSPCAHCGAECTPF